MGLNPFTFSFGLVFILFGLGLIFFQQFFRKVGSGVAQASADVNNAKAKIVGAQKVVNFTGTDQKYSPSRKGLSFLGMFFILFGVVIWFL